MNISKSEQITHAQNVTIFYLKDTYLIRISQNVISYEFMFTQKNKYSIMCV